MLEAQRSHGVGWLGLRVRSRCPNGHGSMVGAFTARIEFQNTNHSRGLVKASKRRMQADGLLRAVLRDEAGKGGRPQQGKERNYSRDAPLA